MQYPDSLAESLVRSHWASARLPVAPGAVARALGVAVGPLPETAFPGPSGHYTVEGERPTVRFNPTVPVVVQRFAVAHALGHHALGHGPRPVDAAAQFDVLQADGAEQAANAFALALLMPAQAVRFFLARTGDRVLEDLCGRFGVSEVAMAVRLRRLGLLR